MTDWLNQWTRRGGDENYWRNTENSILLLVIYSIYWYFKGCGALMSNKTVYLNLYSIFYRNLSTVIKSNWNILVCSKEYFEKSNCS